MAQGLLEVAGAIDLGQFWPVGESDADTVHIGVVPGAFRFRPDKNSAFQVTHAFEGAAVRGKARKDCIDSKGRVTIRLQGIDAPELHYRPDPPKSKGESLTQKQRTAFNHENGNFRQFYGETATLALHSFLAKAGASPLACIVRTAVDQPNDVFDTYGRLVGDIFIKAGGHEVNVNHWLAEHGWAFPTFYSSMSSSEIADVSALAETARKSKSGFWKQASANVLAFDSTLLYRKGGPPDPQGDRGSVILPKLFRRVATWAVAKKTKLVTGSFQKYLSAYPDACYATHDLLEQGLAAATHRRLDEFVTAQGVFTVQARDLVFQEATSRVVARNGTPVHW